MEKVTFTSRYHIFNLSVYFAIATKCSLTHSPACPQRACGRCCWCGPTGCTRAERTKSCCCCCDDWLRSRGGWISGQAGWGSCWARAAPGHRAWVDGDARWWRSAATRSASRWGIPTWVSRESSGPLRWPRWWCCPWSCSPSCPGRQEIVWKTERAGWFATPTRTVSGPMGWVRASRCARPGPMRAGRRCRARWVEGCWTGAQRSPRLSASWSASCSSTTWARFRWKGEENFKPKSCILAFENSSSRLISFREIQKWNSRDWDWIKWPRLKRNPDQSLWSQQVKRLKA